MVFHPLEVNSEMNPTERQLPLPEHLKGAPNAIKLGYRAVDHDHGRHHS
jgi:hypothetical protein